MKAFLAAALTFGLAASAAAEDGPDLTIYTYDSFVSDWGPGPAVESAFEEACGCDVAFIAAGDGASILSRLKLEGGRTEADIVLGLDTNLTAAAAASGLIAPHGIDAGALDMPMAWEDPFFLPYDWGYFAFIYDTTKLATPPASLRELAASDVSLLIQDPRTSTPGLGLLLWVKSVFGDDAADIWGALGPKIVTVTKGWDEAYGLFLEGEADMVLSYTTSPSYHIIAEGDDTKKAALFAEGHYMQVEVAGIVAGTPNETRAREFLAFMMTDGFQSVIPTTNWMFPAVTPDAGLPEGFAAPLPAGKSLILSPEDAASMREPALSEWLDVLAR